MKKGFIGYLDGDKVIVIDSDAKSQLIQKNFGEKHTKYLALDLFEACYLAEKGTVSILRKGKKISPEKLIELVLKKNEKKYFLHKFEVYKDIRSKGYVIKTGLKFGFDFRIYPKGKKISEEHTQFVLDVLPENKKITSQRIAKSVRMAVGLHTDFILAIVDNELEISYYKITREKF